MVDFIPRVSARVSAIALMTGLLLAASPQLSYSQTAPADISPPSQDPGVLITAEQVQHDQAKGVVSAEGKVEITTDERILRADRVSYDTRNDVVSAEGNVVILEPTGEVFFADKVQLRDQLRNGFIFGIRALLSDNSRMAANAASRRDGNKTIMSKAVYSPCNLCPDNPGRAPLWQLKAHKVEHNQLAQRIDYKDVVLEVYGVPIAYSPFFSHPDPTVKRKSGFLAPSLKSTSELGSMVTVPYYWVIAPHRDLTFSPTFTTKEGVILAGEYRERTETGEYKFDASVTYPEKRDANNQLEGDREIRGHLRGDGKFDIDDTWRWGFSAFASSDDTYLDRYRISGSDVLESNAYIEGFRGRNYAAANAWAYQDLRQNQESGQTPHVLPLLEYSYVGEPGKLGQRFNFETSFLSLVRTDGRDTTRMSANVGWRLPYIGPAGDVYTLNANVRADGYVVNDSDGSLNRSGGNQEDGFDGRIWPTLSFDWRYPFVRRDGTTRQIIEPIVQAVVTPNEGNSKNIPNEDSQSFEFDDTNLFSENRFPGIDRVEDGPRLNYGLRAGVYGESGGYSSFLFGQTLRARKSGTFDGNTGLEEHLSDYVGRIQIVPGPYLSYTQRFRMDRDSLNIRRNEIDLEAGPKALRFKVGYAELEDELANDEFISREELRLSGTAKITPNWTLTAYDQIDLTDDGGTIKYGGTLTYLDECIEVSFGMERRFTQDRDIQPSTDFNFRVVLRGLG